MKNKIICFDSYKKYVFIKFKENKNNKNYLIKRLNKYIIWLYKKTNKVLIKGNIYYCFYNKNNKVKVLSIINKLIIKNNNKYNENIKYLISKDIEKIYLKYKKILKDNLKIEELNKNYKYKENKIIFKMFIKEIIINVIENNNDKLENQTLYILVNNNNFNIEKFCFKFIDLFLDINIISNSKIIYRKIEENKIEKFEYISVLNNKRKSLSRAKYIINIDFNEQEINKFNINRSACILNMSKYKILNVIGFDGSIINNIDILNLKYKYDINDIIELISNYKEKKNNNMYQEIIKELEYKIENRKYNLIGNNTIIKCE